MSLSVAARIAGRELRGGLKGFRVFLACLALGVGAIAAVGSVRASIEAGLEREGAAILGGALIANSNRYYYDDGFYGYDEPSPVYGGPYYGDPGVYYAPRAYGPRQRVRPGTQRDPARGGMNR